MPRHRHDRPRATRLPGIVAFWVVPLVSLLYVAMAETRGDLALYATLPLLAGTFSAFDAIFGLAPLAARGETHRHDHILPWLYIPLQIAVTLSGAVVAARAGRDAATLVGLALAIGAVAGIFGMLAAHEMIHSKRPAERWLGLAMLAATTYMHFQISHVRVHHPLAATLDDPATARRGESVYRFILRSTVGQFRAAFELEHRRGSRAGQPLIGNRLCRYVAVSLAIYGVLGIALGRRAVEFFALQSAVAIFVLETFNYVVHYGLLRRKLPDGQAEPFGTRHAWNAPQRFTNWALMNGGHHSDHHRKPARGYAALMRDGRAPELPAGYAATMMSALVPPLWRRIIHPRLERLEGHSREHILPQAREI